MADLWIMVSVMEYDDFVRGLLRRIDPLDFLLLTTVDWLTSSLLSFLLNLLFISLFSFCCTIVVLLSMALSDAERFWREKLLSDCLSCYFDRIKNNFILWCYIYSGSLVSLMLSMHNKYDCLNIKILVILWKADRKVSIPDKYLKEWWLFESIIFDIYNQDENPKKPEERDKSFQTQALELPYVSFLNNSDCRVVFRKKDFGANPSKTNPSLRNSKEDSLDINLSFPISLMKRKITAELWSRKRKFKF